MPPQNDQAASRGAADDATSNTNSAFAFSDPAQPSSTGASGRKVDTPTRATDRVVRTAGKQARWLKSQAATKARQFAETGKGRVDEHLDGITELATRGAATIEERYGPEYGRYARQAADFVTQYAGGLREKNIDELIDDSRSFVRKNSVAVVAGAALVGFAVARVVQAGLAEPEDGSGTADVNFQPDAALQGAKV